MMASAGERIQNQILAAHGCVRANRHSAAWQRIRPACAVVLAGLAMRLLWIAAEPSGKPAGLANRDLAYAKTRTSGASSRKISVSLSIVCGRVRQAQGRCHCHQRHPRVPRPSILPTARKSRSGRSRRPSRPFIPEACRREFQACGSEAAWRAGCRLFPSRRPPPCR